MASDLSLTSALEDAARLEALLETELLDSPVEEAFDRFTKIASRILNCPVSLVSLLDKDRQFIKSHVGVPEPMGSIRQTPLSHSLCKYVVRLAIPLVIEDARIHPLVHDHPVIKDLGVIAYLGIPLTTKEGHTLGSLCAIDTKPHLWEEEAIRLLSDLATMVMTEIELRRTSRILQKTCLQLRDAEAAREELAAMLVHDLRNPLGSMLSAMELVENPALDECQRECLGIAQTSGRHLLGMISDILDVSKADAGRMELNLTEVAPEEIARAAVAQLSHSAEAAGVTLEVQLAPTLPPLRADAEKLRRLLVNLIANSIQHSPRGVVTVSVEAGEDGGTVIFAIQDNGYGIPAEAQGRIFEKYGAVSSRRAGRVSTGLGLAFCKKVAEAHRGEIGVHSTVGVGTTFTVTIPQLASGVPALASERLELPA